mgnify:FL=1
MKWFNKVVFHNYANFKGRARRKEFFMFYLFYMFFVWLFHFLSTVSKHTGIADETNLLLHFFILAMIMPQLSVTARRLHDIGKSGWLTLIMLIPFIGSIVLLVFFVCKDSDPLENKYGPSPKLIASSTDVEKL